MSQYPCNILDSSKGPTTQPPVYVAGSFTLPRWQPHELECSIVDQDITAPDGGTSYVFPGTFDLPQGTYRCRFRLGHEGVWWVGDHRGDIVTDALRNLNNRLGVTPPPPKPEVLDTTAADETSYSKDTVGNTAQPSAAYPAMNGIKDFSNQDERDKSTTEGGPSPILNEDRTLTLSDPSESLRRSKQISVDSSDTSSNKSPAPPVTRGSILQLFFQCLQLVWNLLFGRKAK